MTEKKTSTKPYLLYATVLLLFMVLMSQRRERELMADELAECRRSEALFYESFLRDREEAMAHEVDPPTEWILLEGAEAALPDAGVRAGEADSR